MRRKYSVAAIGVLLLTVHSTLTVAYLLPDNPLSRALAPVTHRYMEPLLTQDWRMFAPDPSTSSAKFWYRYQTAGGEWTNWRDPAESLLREFQKFPVTYKGHILWLHRSVGSRLVRAALTIERSISDDERKQPAASRAALVQQRLVKSAEYRTACRYVLDLARREEVAQNRQVVAVQFQYVQVYVTPFSKRDSPPDKPRFVYYPFPIYFPQKVPVT